jgi:hypothetical protein
MHPDPTNILQYEHVTGMAHAHAHAPVHVTENMSDATAATSTQSCHCFERGFNSEMGVGLQMSRQETSERMVLEEEWRLKLSEFKNQHRQLEVALKRRQAKELKRLQAEIERQIAVVTQDAAKSAAHRALSPRTMSRLQAQNTERLVGLFNKHREERLHLADKVTIAPNPPCFEKQRPHHALKFMLCYQMLAFAYTRVLMYDGTWQHSAA